MSESAREDAQEWIAELYRRVSQDGLDSTALVLQDGATLSLVWSSDPTPATRLTRLLEEGCEVIGMLAYKHVGKGWQLGVISDNDAHRATLEALRSMQMEFVRCTGTAVRSHSITSDKFGAVDDTLALDKMLADQWRDPEEGEDAEP